MKLRLDFEGQPPLIYWSSHTHPGVSMPLRSRLMMLIEELSFAADGGVCLLETAH
jgi:hypothetical protein